jgi:hypothetical protein
VAFLDDVFMKWLHGEKELNNFHIKFNSFHENIKFTLEISGQEISFNSSYVDKQIFSELQATHSNISEI